jgi:hypothetical protein
MELLSTTPLSTLLAQSLPVPQTRPYHPVSLILGRSVLTLWCRRRVIPLWRLFTRAVQATIYVCSQTQDFFTTLLQTSGEVPTPRAAHGTALRVTSTTLLICGGKTNGKADFGDQNVINHDSLYLLNLGTSDLLL